MARYIVDLNEGVRHDSVDDSSTTWGVVMDISPPASWCWDFGPQDRRRRSGPRCWADPHVKRGLSRRRRRRAGPIPRRPAAGGGVKPHDGTTAGRRRPKPTTYPKLAAP